MDEDVDLGYTPESAYTAFEPVLANWTSEELATAAEHVQGLVSHPGYRVVHRLLQEKKARSLNGLIRGKSQPDGIKYVEVVKWIHGLEQTLLAPDAITLAHEKRIEKDDAAARTAERQEADAA